MSVVHRGAEAKFDYRLPACLPSFVSNNPCSRAAAAAAPAAAQVVTK